MNLAKNRSSELSSSPNKKIVKSPAMSTQPKKIIKSDSEKPESTTAEQERKQPIPPPSHPRQYRAIGLIRARYEVTGEQVTQGELITPEGTKIEAVLLGRVISLIKKHLDLTKEHLWVVYPRTKAQDDSLHVQIVGVWEPETLSQNSNEPVPASNEVEDGYFSIRGEVIFFSQEKEVIVIKIKQFPRKEGDKVKFFKLKLQGTLNRPLRHFWDLKVGLEGQALVIKEATDLGVIQQKNPRFKKGGSRRPTGKPYRAGRPTPNPNPGSSSGGYSSRLTPPTKKPTK
ncbi:hypothetical protein Sta7437_2931 [Stanieria cyanosphaera PCC 7437]|uniref:Uncharacterized protein n=1 Tax=Stanieria cyanosphaera (strain ATCC 29371 / PCC 7437) TaxID=111780 RepID=K9XV25_STAC7|nr:hypothetical protein [Stanieria cyanosphaera]AFZ36450.1 hypothetical protein Sta7437_2931 [Stanieria cyanosphaera PCC 7437]